MLSGGHERWCTVHIQYTRTRYMQSLTEPCTPTTENHSPLILNPVLIQCLFHDSFLNIVNKLLSTQIAWRLQASRRSPNTKSQVQVSSQFSQVQLKTTILTNGGVELKFRCIELLYLIPRALRTSVAQGKCHHN